MKTLRFIITIFCLFFINEILSQNSFQKDSLQIKVYTEIEYVDKFVKDIKVSKVFCDYCSENQRSYLSEKAKELAYYDRYNPQKRLVSGIRKFAIIIRVSKKDFSAIKNEEENNLEIHSN